MTAGAPVDDLRRALGPLGAILGVAQSPPSVDDQTDGVRRLERAGYRAVWTNELIGADALVRASLWLAATDRLIVGTCIANMWARPAPTAHAAATQLVQAYPGRFVLGVGVGRPEQATRVGHDFGSPVATARAYLEDLTGAIYPTVLAGNGPKMLALARELADGAMPAGRPPDFTGQARATIGGHKLLVVYVRVDASDSAEAVSDTVRAHLAAGADHVVIGRSYDTDFGVAVDHLEQLASTAQIATTMGASSG